MPDRDRLPEHVTMPLLDVITRNSMDDDYRHVAAARGRSGTPAQRPSPWLAGIMVAVFGLLIVTAAVQNSRSADAREATREGLIRQVQLRSAELREQQGRISALRTETEQMQQDLADLVRAERAQAARTSQLGAISGFTPVTGEGVRIVADDNPSGHEDGVIWDEDLAMLVDGLWAAGAEAISINGHRLTAVTGIRTAGSAINVGNVPIRPPYTVLAIGDNSRLASDFVSTSSGNTWWNMVHNRGYVFEMRNADSLNLPGARRADLRLVREVDPETNKEVTP
jgi:uncharacterized protein YlxW (UPF0749 family)